MRFLSLFAVPLAALIGPALVLAQSDNSLDEIPDRSLPPSLTDFIRPSVSEEAARTVGPNASNERQLELTAELADARARSAEKRSQTLERQNLELKLSLQELQLDRAAALLTAPTEKGNVLRSAIWPTHTIEVHWENPDAAPSVERRWVRDAIARTWERHSALKFIGWDAATPSSRGIRIRINEEGPHCKGLGRYLDGKPDGMVLNFTFRDWCPACGADRQGSIEKIAVHEFGHAIGFAHEQNRDDAPDWCHREQQGTDGDWYLTIYDPESIMNYCSSQWNNAGCLSPLDIRAVQTLYGDPTSGDAPPDGPTPAAE